MRDAVSSIIVFDALRLTLCFSFSKFRYYFECFFLERLKAYLINKKRLWLSRNRITVKTYATVSTSWLVIFWYNHFSLQFILLTTCCNITNVPTTLHLSQVKRIPGFHYFLYLSTNSNSQRAPVPTLPPIHGFTILILFRKLHGFC